jgi:hypothetical protein
METKELFKPKVREGTIKVFFTSDYSIFKYLPGNRDVGELPRKVDKIKKSIKDNGWFRDSLIDVIHGMYVIDGQTRLEALKQIKKETGKEIEIMYRVRKDIELKQVIIENTYRSNWGTKDYISAHVRQGNEQYVKFADLMKKYRLTYTALISIIYQAKAPAQMGLNFKEGKLKVHDWDRVEHCSNDLAMVRQLFKPARTHWFIQPFIKYWHHHNFDTNLFMKRLKNLNSNIKAEAPDCVSYAKLINKIYNSRKQDKVDFSSILMSYMNE